MHGARPTAMPVSASDRSGLLYAVAPADPASFVLAIGILLTVAALASWIPARRAARLSARPAGRCAG